MVCIVVSNLSESRQKLVVGRSGLDLGIDLTILLGKVLVVERFKTAQRPLCLFELGWLRFLPI